MLLMPLTALFIRLIPLVGGTGRGIPKKSVCKYQTAVETFTGVRARQLVRDGGCSDRPVGKSSSRASLVLWIIRGGVYASTPPGGDLSQFGIFSRSSGETTARGTSPGTPPAQNAATTG